MFPGAMRHRIPPLDVAHREPAVAHSVLATADPTLPEVGSVSTNGPRPTDRLKAVPSLLVISVSDRKARYYVDSGSGLLWFCAGLTRSAHICQAGIVCESRQADYQKTKCRPVLWLYTDCSVTFRANQNQSNQSGPSDPRFYPNWAARGARSAARPAPLP